MTNENLAIAPLADLAAAGPAAACLDDVMARIGVDGLAAAFASPALLALIDQHAAAVRDALADAGRVVGAEGLASYTRSIAAGAARRGRSLPIAGQAPTTAAGWLSAEWSLLRLLGVCLLAVESDLR
ncbi:hypothetical protein ACTI_79770 [Actinoplanes sp. OR16]|uniref:DUF6401 family natural product biosynthesis protein n=1 Tax=Actinoplanes sp. OR16 TaxID=946334 RepID=UPI000F6DB46D|nr:DUF6401 family natural product biosynthesis protein [Actinoplanes sp. OR16]BBH71292.1 hypothetical protein ACTI_79770 [Actinoplanes sp. OR16]